jgi:hypothetical protein
LKAFHVLTIAATMAGLQPGTPAVAQAPASGAPVLVLPAGTAIELMIVREVDSDRSRPGDPVKLRVNAPVVIDGTIVIPVGAQAHGEVTDISSSSGLLKRGRLAVDITSISVGDASIPLGTMLEQEARGGESDDFLKIALAPMWLPFSRGNSAKLKAGELLSVQVDEDVCFATEGGDFLPVPCPNAVPEAAPAGI